MVIKGKWCNTILSLMKFINHRKESCSISVVSLVLLFFFFFDTWKCQRTCPLRKVTVTSIFLLIDIYLDYLHWGISKWKSEKGISYHLYICLLGVWHKLACHVAPWMSEFWRTDPKLPVLKSWLPYLPWQNWKQETNFASKVWN